MGTSNRQKAGNTRMKGTVRMKMLRTPGSGNGNKRKSRGNPCGVKQE